MPSTCGFIVRMNCGCLLFDGVRFSYRIHSRRKCDHSDQGGRNSDQIQACDGRVALGHAVAPWLGLMSSMSDWLAR